MDVEIAPVRPTWRGRLHHWAALTFLPLFALLILLTDETGDRVGVVVYAVGVLIMLGVSAVYHSGRLGPDGTKRAKRIDHATILLAISGSYTAVATLALNGAPARHLLISVWVVAAIGAAIRMVWLHAPYPVVAVVYLVVGWIALTQLPALIDALSGAQLAPIVVGGLLYTVGGVVYALHKPDPWPATFGYHEVFHALVVAGVTVHYIAVLSLVLDAR